MDRTAGVARQLYESPDVITSPDFFQMKTGRSVRSVSTAQLNAGFAHSGSELSRVTVKFSDGGAAGYILKRLNPQWDWLMQATEDYECRSVTLWTGGAFDRLPPRVDTTTVACSRDRDGWAILMRDAGDTLVTNRRFTVEQNSDFVGTLAAIHGCFMSPGPDIDPAPPAAGLCSVTDVYRMFAPSMAARFASAESGEAFGREIHRRITEGWDAVAEFMPRDVAEATLALVVNPQPLVRALERYPHTLVHGDFRHSNLGWEPGRTFLLDWQLATWGPPSIDLGRYIGANSPFLPLPKERIIDEYRGALAGVLSGGGDHVREMHVAAASQTNAVPLPPMEEWFDGQLALGLLGGFVQDGWAIALKATTWDIAADTREHWKADVNWWTDVVRRGVAYLDRGKG
jgi:hypothetical protein